MLDPVVRYFETLTPASVAEIDRVYAPDAHFRDPFNEVHDVQSIRRIFEHMFDALIEPRFVVTNRIAEGAQAMVEWDFTFRIRRFRPSHGWSVHGVSHLRFAPDGRLSHHRDYWDTGDELYAKLPGIGPIVRFLKRRMA
ncbi:MAG: nuclear transport factor 2 family protein [Burkholderiales bacterium]